jgi:hypothetical protein
MSCMPSVAMMRSFPAAIPKDLIHQVQGVVPVSSRRVGSDSLNSVGFQQWVWALGSTRLLTGRREPSPFHFTRLLPEIVPPDKLR